MINRVVLVGRLTRDVDLRYTSSGVAVANFTIACNKPFKKDGEEQQADFINCVIWRKPAESLANYMSKGSLIGVEGSIQTRNYEGTDGKRVYVTEVLAASVQFLESKNKTENQEPSNQQNTQSSYQPSNQSNNQQTQQPSTQNNLDPIDISDDDLPF